MSSYSYTENKLFMISQKKNPQKVQQSFEIQLINLSRKKNQKKKRKLFICQEFSPSILTGRSLNLYLLLIIMYWILKKERKKNDLIYSFGILYTNSTLTTFILFLFFSFFLFRFWIAH